MISLFKPTNISRFVGCTPGVITHAVEIADYCNRLVSEWLSREGKVVYTHGNHWSTESFSCDTRQAILIDVKPIEKKKCVEHEPIYSNTENVSQIMLSIPPKCCRCGVELEANWTEIKEG